MLPKIECANCGKETLPYVFATMNMDPEEQMIKQNLNPDWIPPIPPAHLFCRNCWAFISVSDIILTPEEFENQAQEIRAELRN